MMTRKLDDDNEEKISLNTIKSGEKIYLKIWEINPPAHRIVQDINKIPDHMKIVYEHDGCVVRGVGHRSGRRYIRVNNQVQYEKKRTIQSKI